MKKNTLALQAYKNAIKVAKNNKEAIDNEKGEGSTNHIIEIAKENIHNTPTKENEEDIKKMKHIILNH